MQPWLIVLIVTAIFMEIFLLGSILYTALGWFRFFYHDKLKWHIPDKRSKISSDGYNIHANCKYCGKHIMRDSQGNWFSQE